MGLYNGVLTLLCLHRVQSCIHVHLNKVFAFCYPYILGCFTSVLYN